MKFTQLFNGVHVRFLEHDGKLYVDTDDIPAMLHGQIKH